MRIRKNARLLELMLSSSAYPPEVVFQATPHVCQLNQSPWDVLPISTSSTTPSFPPPPLHPPSNSTSSSYPTQNQLEGGRYSLSGNASIEDSIFAVESFASMKVEMAAVREDDVAPNLITSLNINNKFSKKMMNIDANNGIDDDDNDDIDTKMEEVKMCNKTNGKGWHCRKEAKKGYSSCQHHNHNNNNNNNNGNSRSLPSLPPQSSKVGTGGVRRRGRGPGKKASTSNPYEFYYYSGFGPLWGKRRGGGGERNGEKKREENNVEKEDSPSSSSQIEHDNEVDEAQAVGFMEDEDDSGGGSSSDDDNGRKRARKPVKARSLKSLM